MFREAFLKLNKTLNTMLTAIYAYINYRQTVHKIQCNNEIVLEEEFFVFEVQNYSFSSSDVA